MNENAQDPNELRLSKFGLTCFMAMVVILPISMLIFLGVSLPKKSDNPLPISLRVQDVDATKAVVVTNHSEKPLASIGITLNDAFHFYSKDPLPGGEDLSIPFAHFTRKNGLPFSTESHELTELGVYAKLEDNSRGVFVIESEHLLEDLESSSISPEDAETAEKM